MICRKFTITFILASLSFLSCFSCISSVSLHLRINLSDQIFITLEENLDVSCNLYPAYMAALTLQRNIQAKLDYTIPYDFDVIPNSQLYFFNYNFLNNDNIVNQLFSQGLTNLKKFYVNINKVNYNIVVGSIDIGNPNNSLIKQGQQFTALQTQEDLYIYALDQNYGDINLIFSGYAIFTLESSYISISAHVLDLILEDFKHQEIAYDYQPNKDHALYTEDGCDFTINVKPQQYSRHITVGTYQLLLYPTFTAGYFSIGYAALQGYYVGFDLINYKLFIAEKADYNINPL
ncbi:hypothetical protein ABPG72_009012 [Tetrahymena utriculariae]